MTVSTRARPSGPSTPALIRAAGLCAALGIGLSITDYADIGKWITVLGVLLMIVALHRFGRSGADAPIVFELAPPTRKKRKKKRPSLPAETGNDGREAADLESGTTPADEGPEPER